MLSVSAVADRDAWLSELSIRGASEKTAVSYRQFTDEALATVAQFHAKPLSELLLSDIDRDAVLATLARYRTRPDGRTGAPSQRATSSVASFYTALRSLLNWAVSCGKLPSSPAATVKPPKTPVRIPKALPVEGCAKLVDVSRQSRFPSRDELAVRMALSMGLRLAELASLTLDSFSPSLSSPSHLVVRGKGDKERTVPVPTAVAACLESYLPVRTARLESMGSSTRALFISSRRSASGAHLTPAGLGQVFDALCTSAGVKAPGVRAHAARHSFATHALSSGSCDLMEVKELLGHASVATTQGYLKVDPARLAAGVESSPMSGL